ncbi:hypothetical protein ABZ831_34455, partial [Streptomyces sp. NPDC047123]
MSAAPSVVPQRQVFPVGAARPKPSGTENTAKDTARPAAQGTAPDASPALPAVPDAADRGRPTAVPGPVSPTGPGAQAASAAPDPVAVRAESPVQPVQRRPHVRRVRRAQADGTTPAGAQRPGLGGPLSASDGPTSGPAPQDRPRRTPIGAPVPPGRQAPGTATPPSGTAPAEPTLS